MERVSCSYARVWRLHKSMSAVGCNQRLMMWSNTYYSTFLSVVSVNTNLRSLDWAAFNLHFTLKILIVTRSKRKCLVCLHSHQTWSSHNYLRYINNVSGLQELRFEVLVGGTRIGIDWLLRLLHIIWISMLQRLNNSPKHVANTVPLLLVLKIVWLRYCRGFVTQF